MVTTPLTIKATERPIIISKITPTPHTSNTLLVGSAIGNIKPITYGKKTIHTAHANTIKLLFILPSIIPLLFLKYD